MYRRYILILLLMTLSHATFAAAEELLPEELVVDTSVVQHSFEDVEKSVAGCLIGKDVEIKGRKFTVNAVNTVVTDPQERLKFQRIISLLPNEIVAKLIPDYKTSVLFYYFYTFITYKADGVLNFHPEKPTEWGQTKTLGKGTLAIKLTPLKS